MGSSHILEGGEGLNDFEHFKRNASYRAFNLYPFHTVRGRRGGMPETYGILEVALPPRHTQIPCVYHRLCGQADFNHTPNSLWQSTSAQAVSRSSCMMRQFAAAGNLQDSCGHPGPLRKGVLQNSGSVKRWERSLTKLKSCITRIM